MNKEQKRIYMISWRKNNREKMNKYRKNWREKHSEKVKEYENSDKRKQDRKSYQKDCLTKIRNLRKDFGGKCAMCGFNDIRILHFHHLRDKRFEIAAGKMSKDIEELREEAKKCILLCPNCHALIHLQTIDL